LNLLADLNELINKNSFDLSKLDPNVLDSIKMWGGNGELYALPLWSTYSALYYNKDIFDKFGVPYPKDGMTWDEAIELATKLTRTDGHTAFRGIDADLFGVYSQLSMPYVDSKSNAPLLETDGFKKTFQLFHTIANIPGNENRKGSRAAFLTDRNLAMLAYYADVTDWLRDLSTLAEFQGKARVCFRGQFARFAYF
jgi:multiple sugar transport system substrate-binding protein